MNYLLFGLAVKRVLLAVRTIFLKFHPSRIVAAILFGGVIAILALIAGQCNHRADIFLFGCHFISRSLQLRQTDTPLCQDLGDHTGANRQTTFANCKL